ncbi:unnamed protein product [Gadus morhua 'NCC']
MRWGEGATGLGKVTAEMAPFQFGKTNGPLMVYSLKTPTTTTTTTSTTTHKDTHNLPSVQHCVSMHSAVKTTSPLSDSPCMERLFSACNAHRTLPRLIQTVVPKYTACV